MASMARDLEDGDDVEDGAGDEPRGRALSRS